MTLTASQIADGWKSWGGGPCPVKDTRGVSVIYRDGKTSTFMLNHIGSLIWRHDGQPDDIIAYKEQSHAAGE